ncbi:polysaccharide deacetylase family protein [Erysipelothrix aquatica]|uniref:polysaccharide deacetylase family protein n=1 Tax=Erysipelothrix aquatica TaxID=2683714 RepID=UPI0013580400|nr:polysaccharide deacetylase family protein [Erysipelothrix aquatica]
MNTKKAKSKNKQCFIVVVLLILSIVVVIKASVNLIQNDKETTSSSEQSSLSPSSTKELTHYNKHVTLTFDDGPSSAYTPVLLDALKAEQVTATFFLLGQNIEGNESLVKRINIENHTVANHTFSHPDLVYEDNTKIESEFAKTDALIYDLTGKKPEFVRTPYGSNNKEVLRIAGRPNILWNVDSMDWDLRDSKRIIDKIMHDVKDGSIILMHDIHKESVEAIPTLITLLHEEGYGIIDLHDLLGTDLKAKNYYNR